jgi:predicted transcriptional regulator
MKNKKVFVPIQTFKNLISEDTIHILQVLDKQSLSLIQLSKKTQIPQNQLESELYKLINGKVIKNKKRNQQSYYTLTFKGSSLLHPENSRIVTLCSISILTLLVSIGSIIQWLTQTIPTPTKEDTFHLLQEGDNVVEGPVTLLATESTQQMHNPLYSWIALIGISLFIILISVTYWRYKKNKPQAL